MSNLGGCSWISMILKKIKQMTKNQNANLNKKPRVAITNLCDIKEHNHTEHDRFEILNNH